MGACNAPTRRPVFSTMPTTPPVDLLGADLATDPRFRRLRRAQRAWDLVESARFVLLGVGLLAFGFAIWRASVPPTRGPATQRAAKEAHDFGVVLFVGGGAVTFLAGGALILWSAREERREDDGKWG